MTICFRDYDIQHDVLTDEEKSVLVGLLDRVWHREMSIREAGTQFKLSCDDFENRGITVTMVQEIYNSAKRWARKHRVERETRKFRELRAMLEVGEYENKDVVEILKLVFGRRLKMVGNAFFLDGERKSLRQMVVEANEDLEIVGLPKIADVED